MINKSIIASILLLSPAFSMDRTLPVVGLPLYADAANNEGGLVQRMLDETQLWAGLHMPSDCPFQGQDAPTFQDIASSQTYPLKESGILKYNEARANQSYLMTLSWYLDHLREIFELSPLTVARMTAHVHRGRNGIELINSILIPLLEDYYGQKLESIIESDNPKNYQITISLPNNTVLHLRNGHDPENFTGYERSYLVYSIGHVMGINKEWEPGSLLLTEDFIPTDETISLKERTKGVIYEDKSYKSPNHLKANLMTILADEDRQKKVMDIINQNSRYQSPNPLKKFGPVTPLQAHDFHYPKTLNIKTLYSPKMDDYDFLVILKEHAKL